MPLSFLSAVLCILLASCCATTAPAPTATPLSRPEPVFREPRVVALVPGQDTVLLVLAHGQRAGIKLGDRGYAPCHDGELRIIEVFEFRSQALMKRPAKLPDLHRVRIYLHGADPKPWCPDPEPAPR